MIAYSQKVIALLLVLTMTISMLAGCGAPTKSSSLDAVETELTPLDTISYADAGIYEVRLASNEVTFSADNIEVSVSRKVLKENADAYLQTVEVEDGQSFEYYSDEAYDTLNFDARATMVDEHTIQVSFTDEDYIEAIAYDISVLASALAEKAVATATLTLQSEAAYTVESSVAEVYSTATSLETTLTLADGSYADQIDTAAVQLADGFADMQVSGIERVDDTTLNVAISGGYAQEEGGSQYAYGTIELLPAAIKNADAGCSVDIGIIYPSIAVLNEEMTYADGVMNVYVMLYGCEFSENLEPGMFTVQNQGEALEVLKAERTYGNEAKLSLAVSADNLDDAIVELSGGTVSALNGALSIDAGLDGPATISGARIDGYVSYAENSEDKTRLTVKLFCENGYLENLTADKLIFGADFQNATDIAVEEEDLGAVVTFSLPEAETAEDAALTGNIAVKDGTLKNQWGTDSADTSVCLSWSSEDETKGSVIEAAKDLWSAYGDTITSVGSGAVSAVGAVTTILELAGVIESTDAKIDKVYNEMNKQFAAVNQKLGKLQDDVNTLINKNDEILKKLFSSTRQSEVNVAQLQWNNFYTDLKKLENLTDSFKNLSVSECYNIIKNETVTVYKDTKGTVCVQDTTTGRATTGYKMAEDNAEYVLPDDFVAKIIRNKKLGDSDLTELKTLLVQQYGDTIAKEIIDSICLQAVYTTASRNKFSDYTELFKSVASALGGHTVSTNNPLSYYDTIIESAYNWDPSTYSIKTQMRLYVSSVMANAAAYAFCYVGCIEADSAGEIETMQKTVDQVSSILISNTGIHTAEDNYAYNLYAKRPLTMRQLEVYAPSGYTTGSVELSFTDMVIKEKILSTDEVVRTLQERGIVCEDGKYGVRVKVTSGIGAKDYGTYFIGDFKGRDYLANDTGKFSELFVSPVVGTLEMQAMYENAKLRKTDYLMEMVDMGIVMLDPEDGFPYNVDFIGGISGFTKKSNIWGMGVDSFTGTGKISSHYEGIIKDDFPVYTICTEGPNGIVLDYLTDK